MLKTFNFTPTIKEPLYSIYYTTMTRKAILFFNVFFVIDFLFKFYKKIISTPFTYSYTEQSNFVNYSQGFIRRGLFGELTKTVAKLNLDPFIFIKVFSLTIFIIVILFFSKFLKRTIIH